MKEYPQEISILSGLRKSSKLAPDSDGCVECWNLRPQQERLVPLEPIVDNITGITISWPFPQLFIGKNRKYLVTADTFYEVGADWSLTQKLVLLTPSTIPWKWVDYTDYVVFTNGVTAVKSNSTTLALSEDATLVANDLCDYKGQMIAAGLVGNDNWVSWSEIGSATFTNSRTNVAGNRPLHMEGKVYNVKRLGEWVICYGENGILGGRGVKAPVPGFAWKELANIGIVQNALTGDLNTHFCVCADGSLRMISIQQDGAPGVQDLDYTEFFSQFIDETLVTNSWNSKDNEGYICTEDAGFVISQYGVGQLGKRYTSASYIDGELVGIFMPWEDDKARIISHDINFKQQAVKQTKLLALEFNTSEDDIVEGKIGYRFKKAGEFSYTPFARVNPEGWMILPVSANSFRYCIQSHDPVNFYLSSLMARWQLDDKRGIRGQYK